MIPLRDRFLHTLILGPTGSGKTSLAILPMIEQDIRGGMGITVIEPKIDLVEKVNALAKIYDKKCIYFNPSYNECPKFNPLEGDEEDIIETMVLCVRIFMKDSDDFYKNTCESVLRSSLKVLKRVKSTATLVDLERFLLDTCDFAKKVINRLENVTAKEKNEIRKKENMELLHFFNTDYFHPKNFVDKGSGWRNTSGLRLFLSKLNGNFYMRKVLNPKDGKSEIRFLNHIEKGEILSISTNQGLLGLVLSRFLGYFIILNFQSDVFKRMGNEITRKPHFLYIDEFQEFANPDFGIMLSQGRSYRVASILATQNKRLISGDGSQEGQVFLENVMSNARNLILFPDLPPNDCEYFSKMFGEKISYKYGKSVRNTNMLLGNDNTMHTYSETMERYIKPTEISHKKFGEMTYKIVVDNSARIAGHGKVKFLQKKLRKKIDEYTVDKHTKEIIEELKYYN